MNTNKKIYKKGIKNTTYILMIILIIIIGVVLVRNNGELKDEDCKDTGTDMGIEEDIADRGGNVEEKESGHNEILKLLESQGIDTSGMEEEHNTPGGATLLGGAKPIKEFRTLASAEEEFGKYLGFHNRLESLEGYELCNIFIIEESCLHAIYNNSDETKTIVVKLSMIEKSNELINIYNEYGVQVNENIGGVEVKCRGYEEGVVNLIHFDTNNGRGYSIHTNAGLTLEESIKVAEELITNLRIMDDWLEECVGVDE